MLQAEWLDQFLTAATQETQTLRENGADCQATARVRLLDQLREAATSAGDETVSVEEASAQTGVNPETIRRAVRRGELADTRTSKHQNIRIRKSDLPKLAAKRRQSRKVTVQLDGRKVADKFL